MENICDKCKSRTCTAEKPCEEWYTGHTPANHFVRFNTSEKAAHSVNPDAWFVQRMDDAEEWKCPNGETIEIAFEYPRLPEEWRMTVPPPYVGWYIENISPF